MVIGEVFVEMNTGGEVIEYIRAKSRQKFGNKLKDMISSGVLDFGSVKVQMSAVDSINVEFHEVQ